MKREKVKKNNNSMRKAKEEPKRQSNGKREINNLKGRPLVEDNNGLVAD